MSYVTLALIVTNLSKPKQISKSDVSALSNALENDMQEFVDKIEIA